MIIPLLEELIGLNEGNAEQMSTDYFHILRSSIMIPYNYQEFKKFLGLKGEVLAIVGLLLERLH